MDTELQLYEPQQLLCGTFIFLGWALAHKARVIHCGIMIANRDQSCAARSSPHGLKKFCRLAILDDLMQKLLSGPALKYIQKRYYLKRITHKHNPLHGSRND